MRALFGDVQLVNANSLKEDIVPNDDAIVAEQTSSNIAEETDEYFSSTRIQRESMYSQMLETYQKMVDSAEISNEQKAIRRIVCSNPFNERGSSEPLPLNIKCR